MFCQGWVSGMTLLLFEDSNRGAALLSGQHPDMASMLSKAQHLAEKEIVRLLPISAIFSPYRVEQVVHLRARISQTSIGKETKRRVV
jgi:hypothetical protein